MNTHKLLVKISFIWLAAIALCAAFMAPAARGAVILSNLGQINQGTTTFSSPGVPSVAQSFTTGTSQLTVDSVAFYFGTADPSTPTAPLQVAIYSSIYDGVNNWQEPGSLLTSLSGTNSYPDSTPAALYTFTATGGYTLDPSTQYWIVFTNPDTINSYSIGWTNSATLDTAANGWTVNTSYTVAFYYPLNVDPDWQVLSSSVDQQSFLFSVNAIPEPTTAGMLLAGASLSVVAALRRRMAPRA